MKIKYRGVIYETVEKDGRIVSKGGKIIFGKVGQPLVCGEEVVEENDPSL